MAFMTQPTVMSQEVKAILTQDDSITPHVIMLRAKLRSLAFRVTANAINAGETSALIAFLPAGRNRVFFHHSTFSTSTVLGTCSLSIGPYITSYPESSTIAKAVVTANVTSTANTTLFFDELDNAAKGLGLIYNSQEDIPVYLNMGTAMTATTAIQGHIIYGQE